MKEIIILSINQWVEPDEKFQQQLEVDMLRLANYCWKVKEAGRSLEVFWIANSYNLVNLLTELSRSCCCPIDIQFKPLVRPEPAPDDVDSFYAEPNEPDFDYMLEKWRYDVKEELEHLWPDAAVEILAPEQIRDLPVLYYGLEAESTDLDVLEHYDDWYLAYPELIPQNHTGRADTWLALLIGNSDVNDYAFDIPAQQELFLEAAALAMFLEGLEAVLHGYSCAGFCFHQALECFPFDPFYLAYSLDDYGKEQVAESIGKHADDLLTPQAVALRYVLQDKASAALSALSHTLKSDAELFFSLWSASASFNIREPLQVNRFTNALNQEPYEKLRTYNYVSECGLHMVNWD